MQESDIIEVFESYSNQLGWYFSYGNKANQNLLQSDLDAEKKYLILDPVRRTKQFSEYGGYGYASFTGSFILVVKSTIDQVYHNQTDGEIFINRINFLDGAFNVDNSCYTTTYSVGKYVENIKPLIETEIIRLEDIINCSDYRIDEWSITDVTDLFDINLDGIVVNFKLSIL